MKSNVITEDIFSDKPTDTSVTNGKKNPVVNVKKADLQNVLNNVKNTNTEINVIDETQETEQENKSLKKKLTYLSDVKDTHSGEISQPFTISGKKYQMVRALSPDKEKVMGVYAFDDTDELGENLIYAVDEFEKIAKSVVDEEAKAQEEINKEEEVVEPEVKEKPTEEKSDDAEEKMNPNFAGFKHFIVNKKTGKARKFKSIDELAKATMGDGEAYMGIKDFKKFVDEALFGAGKKIELSEEDLAIAGDDDIKMNQMAERLMKQIKIKIPSQIIATIKTPVAQREVIAAFARMIGVPRNGLATLIAGLKDLAKTEEPVQPVTESVKRIIKVKDIK